MHSYVAASMLFFFSFLLWYMPPSLSIFSHPWLTYNIYTETFLTLFSWRWCFFSVVLCFHHWEIWSFVFFLFHINGIILKLFYDINYNITLGWFAFEIYMLTCRIFIGFTHYSPSSFLSIRVLFIIVLTPTHVAVGVILPLFLLVIHLLAIIMEISKSLSNFGMFNQLRFCLKIS